MKASKFTDAQKAYIVKRGEEGVPVAEICREAGISEATFYNWRKKYAGLMPTEMRRLRELEQENARLKKIVADLSLDKEICQTRVRFGYRRIHVLLRREGWKVNIKKTRRIYKELGLQLRNKHPKRRVKAKLREDREVAVSPNDVWAMDFVHDQLATGRKIRVLTMIDTFSRYVPILDPRFNYRGEDVVKTLDRVCNEIGYPKTIRVDQGSEFISRDMDLWAYHNGVTLDFSRPGKPTDNAFIEPFNGRFRAECLNAHWFLSLSDAAEKLEAWRRDYNEQRPRGAIGNKVPIELMKSEYASSPCS